MEIPEFWCEIKEEWANAISMDHVDNAGHEQSVLVCSACGKDTDEFHDEPYPLTLEG